MCCKSSSQPTQTTVTQQNSQPWDAQQTYLKDVFQQAQNAYNANPNFAPFPGQMVAPFSPETQQAFQLQTQRALSGSPLTNAAQGQQLATINGQYLDPNNNPGLQTVLNRTIASVAPQISAQFANAGQGGALQGRAMGLGLGDALGSILYNNYNNERGIQNAAAQGSPNLANVDFQNISALGQVGAAQEQQQQNIINAEMQKYQQSQLGPWQALGQYAGDVSGNYGGTSSGTSSTMLPSPNPWAQGIGTLASLAGIGGMIFSDERLKENVERVGQTDEGLPIYTYNYIWGGPTQMGVMAQDVLEVNPEAVGVTPQGLLAVDYGAL